MRYCRLNSTNTCHRKLSRVAGKDSMPRVSVNRAALVTRTDPLPGGVVLAAYLPVPARPPVACQAKRTGNVAYQVLYNNFPTL